MPKNQIVNTETIEELTEENENSGQGHEKRPSMSFNLSMSNMNASPNSKNMGIGLLNESRDCYVGQTS